MKILCLSDLHLKSDDVVVAIARQRLSPFLSGIAARVSEVSPDAVVVTGDTVCPAQVRLCSALLRSVIHGSRQKNRVTFQAEKFWKKQLFGNSEQLSMKILESEFYFFIVLAKFKHCNYPLL